MRTKWMLWMLAVTMFLSTVCMTVVASASSVVELNIADGSITLSEDGNGNTSYSQTYSDDNVISDTYTGSITIIGNASTLTTNNIKVASGSHDITLSNVYIDVSGTANKCAFDIQDAATANITLADVNILKSGSKCAGLQVPANATVTIAGDGELNATGGSYGAGIGGKFYGDGGTITIYGGTVTATGEGNSPAGIGGGKGGAGGTITIYGGTVTATGGEEYGTGIGGGSGCDGGTITISGGTVTATGGDGGTGIGGGYKGTDGTFSTNIADGTKGNAFIDASSISDQTDQENWSGVIFDGDTGAVYGSPTLATDATIENGKTLTIDNGQTLIIADGVTLTNEDTITNNGTITNSGEINSGRGDFEGNTPSGEGTYQDPFSLEADIIEFKIENLGCTAEIDKEKYTVIFTVPYSSQDVTAITPTITISDGASIEPQSGAQQNFTSPVIYKVTAEDQIVYTEWTVTAKIADETNAEAVARAKGLMQGATVTVAYSADQDAKTSAVQDYVDELLKDADPNTGVKATVAFKDTDTYTVTLTKGEGSETVTDTISITMTITETDDPDIAIVEAAKTAVQNETYATTTQATHADETAVSDYINNLATLAVNNSNVTVAVSTVSYTAPVAGTSASPNGTDGTFTFTVTVSKGERLQKTEQITVIITATAYTGASDEEAVATAKTAVQNATYATTTQATHADETAVSDYIKNLATLAVNNSEVTVAVSTVSYTAPVAGTSASPNGTDGSFTFTITVSKGEQIGTTTEKTVTITATAFVEHSYPASVTYGTSNGTFTVGNGGEIVFTIDGDFEKFVDLYCNGVKLLKDSDYLAKSGSVLITLPATYVNTLSAGAHAFTAVMTDGNATLTLLAVEEVTFPQTGDSTHLLWYVLLASLGLCGLGTLLFARKKAQK